MQKRAKQSYYNECFALIMFVRPKGAMHKIEPSDDGWFT